MNKERDPISSIRIIGGGTAGWMTAAALITYFPGKDIRVIESPAIPTIGVGESTIGFFRQYLDLIGVEDKDFMKACDASYKLSIRFKDFYKKGDTPFHYPFDEVDTTGNTAGINDWYFKKIIYPDTPVSDYAECMSPKMALVKANKLFRNKNKKLPVFDFNHHVAFHLDAVKFGQWLKDNVCIPRGVRHVPQTLTQVEVGEKGIETYYLDHQHYNPMKADLFIDCTGFKSALLGGEMKVPFESYLDILPNNKAWATRLPYKDKRKEMVSWTDCQAIQNGWVWKIPLWSRIGTGYTYSDKYINDEEALSEFKAHLRTTGLTEKEVQQLSFRKLEMKVGTYKELWVKNVVGIGLSAGFIEPLEGNGLFSVHEFIVNLIRTLNRGSVSQWDRDVFTATCKSTFRTFAEFVALHYALSHRDDTPYWKDISSKSFCKTLSSTELTPWIYGFKHAMASKMEACRFNPVGGLHYIAPGMHWFPAELVKLVYEGLNPNNTPLKQNARKFYEKEWKPLVKHLEAKKKQWDKIVKKAPNFYDFLKKDIYD